jgi:pantoate--beta-alanine ligase
LFKSSDAYAVMQTLDTSSATQRLCRAQRSAGKTVALVPTMGALHDGHRSLVRLARERADFVVVSVFVNPIQFGPSEDFRKYPRELGKDLAVCTEAGADAVFLPSVEDMYPKGFSTFVVEESVGKPMEGVSRPTHFRGVTTVVAKLLNVVGPDFLVLGQKDAQQVAVVRKMIRDLSIPVELIVGETLREPDGLAMSSRNRYLTTTQRQDAAMLNRALVRAREMVAAGEMRADRLVAEATHLLAQQRRIRVIYVGVADRDTMEPMREVVPGRSLIALAAWVDEVRLIDNLVL